MWTFIIQEANKQLQLDGELEVGTYFNSLVGRVSKLFDNMLFYLFLQMKKLEAILYLEK